MNIYQSVIAFINSIPVGGEFTTKQFHNHMSRLGYSDGHQPNYRINTYRTYLRSAGFVTNTSRGNWRVNYHVPAWLTLSALEIAKNYKGTQAQRKAIKAKIKEYQSIKATVEPFTAGDKVVYTPNPKSHYSNSDHYAKIAGLIPGGEYEIKTISKHATLPGCWWVTTKGSPFTLASDCFVAVKAETSTVIKFKVGDKVCLTDKPIQDSSQRSWIECDKVKTGVTYTVARVSPEEPYPVLKVKPEHGAHGVYWIRMENFVSASVVVEAPAPKPKRQAVCIDMSDSTAEYVIGKVYEITDEDDKYYYLDGREGGMYKWRFKEITDVKVVEPKKSAYTIKVLCTNSTGYQMTLTEGKIYMARYSSGEGNEELYAIETNDRGDKPGHTIAFKHRFTILTDEAVEIPKPVETPKPEVFKSPFKVGDTVRFIQSKIQSSFYEYARQYSRLTDKREYKVTAIGCNGHSKWNNMFIDVAGCEYHHPYDCFELVGSVETPRKKTVGYKMPEDKTWKYGDKFIAHGDKSTVYTLEDSGSPYSGVLVTWDDDGETRKNAGYNAEEVTKYFKEGIWTIVKGGSKPVPTPKEDTGTTVLCIDNSDGYHKSLTVGKTYQAFPHVSSTHSDIWTIKSNDRGTATSAFKHRFVVVTEEAPKPKVVEPTEDQFIVGVTFTDQGDKHEIEYTIKEITPTGITLQWKSRAGKICSYTVNPNYFTNPYHNRFKIVEQKIKVGHKISCYFLNDLKKPKKLYGNGFRMKWETTYGNHFGMEHRTIEEIDIVDGLWAGRLSGTAGIWIALDSLK